MPPGAADRLAAAEAVLDRLVTARCLDPAEPWALVHGVIARGIDLEVGGERAIDRFVRENLDPTTRAFPASRGAAKVEPHPGYFTKNALELGVPLEHAFPTPDGGRVTLGELVAVQARAYAPAEREAPFFDEEWRLEIVAAAAERDTAQGERAGDLRARPGRCLLYTSPSPRD